MTSCPALVISAPACGSGTTSITAEAPYPQGSLRARHAHHDLPSNPEAVAAFFAG